MNQEVKGLIAVKIPIEHRAFLEANPRFAKTVGTVVGNLVEVYEKIEKMKDMLKDPKLLKSLIDVGTAEQANVFIDIALEAAKGSAIKIDNVSREVLDRVKEELGKDALETPL